MKRLVKSAIAALMLVWCMGWSLPVYASENPSVVLESAGVDMDSRILKVDCSLGHMNTVTNGKLRITYDGSKLQLLENKQGDALAGGMCEVNDCLTGSKKEGEIVFAFASGETLPEKGCLANMSFAISDQVAEGEELHLTVAAEKLAGDKGDVNAEEKGLTVKVKKAGQGNPDGDQGGSGSNSEISGGNQGNSGGSQNGSSSVQGSRNSIGNSRSSSGNSDQSGRDGGDSSSRNNIENSRSKQDEGLKERSGINTEDGDGNASAEMDAQLENVSDGQVPLAAIGNGAGYWWIIPVALLAAVIIFLIWKKKRKEEETAGTNE